MTYLDIVEKLPNFSIFVDFATAYFQLHYFTIWPQRNGPLHNSFQKIFQFADIFNKWNFFPWKFPIIFFLPPKKIMKNKCNHIYSKTTIAETNHDGTKLLKFDIFCNFWFVKYLSYQYINVFCFSKELFLILKFLL